MSFNPNAGSQWRHANAADDYRKFPNQGAQEGQWGSSQAVDNKPRSGFSAAGKSGPPTFYRSKNQQGPPPSAPVHDERESEAPRGAP